MIYQVNTCFTCLHHDTYRLLSLSLVSERFLTVKQRLSVLNLYAKQRTVFGSTLEVRKFENLRRAASRGRKRLAPPPAGFLTARRRTSRNCLTPAGKMTAARLTGLVCISVVHSTLMSYVNAQLL